MLKTNDRTSTVSEVTEPRNRFGREFSEANVNEADLVVRLEREGDSTGWVLFGEAKVWPENESFQSVYRSARDEEDRRKAGLQIYGIEPCGLTFGRSTEPVAFAYRHGTLQWIGIPFEDVKTIPTEAEGPFITYPAAKVPQKPTWPKALEDRLEQLRRLPENWDSYSGRRISSKAIGKGRTLIDEVGVQCGAAVLEDTFIAPCSNGGIQLEWKAQSERELVVRVSPSGRTATFLLEDPKSKQEQEGTIKNMEDWNRLLAEFCKGIAVRKDIG